MPVASMRQYREMFRRASEGHWAIPAINVTNIVAANAALKGFADAKSDGIIQISTGGGTFASGLNVKDMALGAFMLAQAVRTLAERYNVLIGLHTDHCQPDKCAEFIDPLIKISRERVRCGGEPLFNSHMLDASTLPLEENLALSKKYLELCNDAGMLLELEIGVVGGEEEGASGGHPDRLYTSSEDMLLVRQTLGVSRGAYLLAATFGNVHGSYKPGFVKLNPEILRAGQEAVEKAYGKESRFDLVFHGGSGSELSDIRKTLEYGVVKMNVDTDTQYAFTHPIALHMCQNVDKVFKMDGEVGDKKFYDPRSYLKKAEESMALRVGLAAENLLSKGKSLLGG